MSSMKIFNKGARDFLLHGIRIVPDKFTEIPEQHVAAAAKLLKDYPNELLSGDSAPSDAKAAVAKAGILEKENATLKAQVEKLQKLLVSTDGAEAEALANERADKAEADLADARAKVKELEDALLEAVTINRKVDAAIDAKAPEAATEAAPAAEAPEATETPAPAATGGKSKKNR